MGFDGRTTLCILVSVYIWAYTVGVTFITDRGYQFYKSLVVTLTIVPVCCPRVSMSLNSTSNRNFLGEIHKD